MNVTVIGSGLAGIAAARALLDRGCAVTILDVGETLDPERRRIVEQLRDGTAAERGMLTRPRGSESAAAEEGGIPEKLVHFGSDYILATDRPFAGTRASRGPYPTFAQGGFSNIWGAAVLPTDACDMADWPVSRGAMEPYFRKASALLPLVGDGGTLAQAFPAYRERLGEIDPGPQGRALLADLDRAEAKLTARDTLYGRARLAVHTEPAEDGVLACNNCGDCAEGCVRGAIFGVPPLLAGMIRRGEIRYRGAIFIERVAEDGNKPRIEGIDLATQTRLSIESDALIVAAGPINTTRLLLRSRELYRQPVRLKESQKFVIPMLRRRAAPTTIEAPSVTLSAAFIETKVRALSDHWVHAQIVAMNRTIAENAPLPGARSACGRRFWSPLLRRVMAAWCGMHSDHSSALELTLLPAEAGGPDRLVIEGKISEAAHAAGRTAARDLFHKGLLFDTVFCHWMIRFANPGRGTHCGASFPMRATPAQRFDTDRWGRPFGWSRIFVVDGAVLPSIPGTTMALPVMANAYRIGQEAPL